MFIVKIKKNKFMIMGVSKKDIEKAKNSKLFSNVEIFNKVDTNGNVVDTIMELNGTIYNVKKIFEKNNEKNPKTNLAHNYVFNSIDEIKKFKYESKNLPTINQQDLFDKFYVTCLSLKDIIHDLKDNGLFEISIDKFTQLTKNEIANEINERFKVIIDNVAKKISNTNLKPNSKLEIIDNVLWISIFKDYLPKPFNFKVILFIKETNITYIYFFKKELIMVY